MFQRELRLFWDVVCPIQDKEEGHICPLQTMIMLDSFIASASLRERILALKVNPPETDWIDKLCLMTYRYNDLNYWLPPFTCIGCLTPASKTLNAA